MEIRQDSAMLSRLGRRKSPPSMLLFKWIKVYIKQHGYAPTIREIVDGLGYSSTSTALYGVRRLKENGYITFEENRSRTIRVLKKH